MTLAAILLLVTPVLLTGLVAFMIRVPQKSLRLILAFSAAYLFAISIMHLLPEVILNGNPKTAGLFIVLGFCLQLLIDTFSTGIEHGHVHLHDKSCEKHLPYGIIAGLFLHSFLEGLPVYDLNSPSTDHVNFQLVLGLAVHNFPITLAFVGLIKEHGSDRRSGILLLIAFSLMSPLGYLVNYALQYAGFQYYGAYSNAAYALVIGIFLHISTTTLFESSVNHKYNIAKAVVMGIGIVVAYLIS